MGKGKGLKGREGEGGTKGGGRKEETPFPFFFVLFFFLSLENEKK